MLINKALDSWESTDRLLNSTPLRPCALRGVVRGLRAYNKTGTVLNLLTSIFPEKSRFVIDGCDEWLLDLTWINKLYFLLRLIKEADYFEVNWELMDWLYDGWLYEDAPYFSEMIEHFLDCMPVVFYGTGSKVVWDNCEGIVILNGLLNVDFYVSDCFLIEYDMDDLTNRVKRDMYDRLLSRDFSGCDSPLRFLPEIAKVVVKETDNFILDNDQTDLETEDWIQYPLLSWKDDFDKVSYDWQAAKPVIKNLNLFMDWLNEDDANVRLMVNEVLGEYGL